MGKYYLNIIKLYQILIVKAIFEESDKLFSMLIIISNYPLNTVIYTVKLFWILQDSSGSNRTLNALKPFK